MIAPSLFNDANGEYRGTDKKVYANPGFKNYTTFSLWDTYRAWHPLSTIIFPDRVEDYIRTFLAIYKQQGKLPVWHLHGNETNTMVGYSAVPVLVDAYLKRFPVELRCKPRLRSGETIGYANTMALNTYRNRNIFPPIK